MNSPDDEIAKAFSLMLGKSVIKALILGALIGPMAMFYISVTAGVAWTLGAILIALVAPPAVVIVWLLAIVFAPLLASRHNKAIAGMLSE